MCVFKALYIPFIVTNVNSLCGKTPTDTHTHTQSVRGAYVFFREISVFVLA